MNRIMSWIKPIYWKLRKWLANPRRSALEWLKWQNKYCTQLACKGMVWRGFSRHPIHPKHLFDTQSGAHLHPFVTPGMRLLDVGCGNGMACLKALELGAASAVGIERNPDSIRQLRELAQARGVTIAVHDLDLEVTPYPFPDQSFDLIHCTDVLEHLEQRVACLREMKRIKTPEAPVIISIPNTDTTWKRRLRRVGIDSRDDTDHKIEYTRATLEQEIHQSGLRLASPLAPVVPSFPWHGLIALSAVLSPALYRALQQWKYRYAQRHPEETMGWVFHLV